MAVVIIFCFLVGILADGISITVGSVVRLDDRNGFRPVICSGDSFLDGVTI